MLNFDQLIYGYGSISTQKLKFHLKITVSNAAFKFSSYVKSVRYYNSHLPRVTFLDFNTSYSASHDFMQSATCPSSNGLFFKISLSQTTSNSNYLRFTKMVKLASARESRMYGGRLTRQRAEYMNAGVYVFASFVLLVGFVVELSKQPKAGLVLLLIGLALIAFVNVHDLFAHLVGIDFNMALMEYDSQLGLVEFAVPVVQAVGSLLEFLGILLLLIQAEKRYGHWKMEKHAVNLLVAGPVLWLLGSVHNACQIYERAEGHVQILQQSVHIPFLMGSLLFVVGSVINIRKQIGRGTDLLGGSWVWLGISGSLLFLLGGIANVVKVFKMQQIDGMLRLEKLRGGAQDRLMSEREGQVPLILEDQRKRKKQQVVEEVVIQAEAGATPYKDVLIGQSQP